MTTISIEQFSRRTESSDGRTSPPSTTSDTGNTTTPDGAWEQSDSSEDEEVEMNTMMGVRGMDDSDMFTDCEGNQVMANDTGDADEGDDDDEDSGTAIEDEPERGDVGLVAFVSDRVSDSSVPLIHPKAASPARATLSPLEEEADESDETSESSVGARGVALSLGTNSSMSQSSAEEDVDHDEEETDDESSAGGDVDPGYSGENEDFDDDEEEPGEDVDDELSGLLETLGDRLQDSDHEEAYETSERQIGVTLDRDDLLTIPKTKRVLSFNTLTALNSEICRIRDSPKRSKLDGDAGTTPLLAFSLGPAALSEAVTTSLTKSLEFRLRRESPLVSSSDDEALDRQLEAELDPQDSESRDNSPVPLLTPPESPIMFEINGDRATICEWPSNLVVDSALASTMNEPQPLSPTALKDFEGEDANPSPKRASDLTPLLRGIAVRDS